MSYNIPLLQVMFYYLKKKTAYCIIRDFNNN